MLQLSHEYQVEYLTNRIYYMHLIFNEADTFEDGNNFILSNKDKKNRK